MLRPAARFIALRYSRQRQGRSFTSFINRFALLGITLGVAALIVVTAVMNGFERELKQRILGVIPHLTVTAVDAPRGMQAWQDVASTISAFDERLTPQPYVRNLGLVQVPGAIQPLALEGLFPATSAGENAVESDLLTDLASHMIRGEINQLRSGSYHLIIGQAFALKHNLLVGDKVRVVMAAGGIYTPLGLLPSQRQVTISGIFAMQSEVDSQLAFMHGDDLARLLRFDSGAVSGLRLQLAEPFLAPELRLPLQQQLGNELAVADWRSRYGQLFAAVAMEKRMMWLMLTLIIFVAGFNIISGLLLMIQDKRQDIAILQTLGARPALVHQVFLLQGAYNGIMGSVYGVLLGLLVAFNLNEIVAAVGINLSQISGQGLPVLLIPSQLGFIVLCACSVALLAALYPAYAAAKTSPAEALRYD